MYTYRRSERVINRSARGEAMASTSGSGSLLTFVSYTRMHLGHNCRRALLNPDRKGLHSWRTQQTDVADLRTGLLSYLPSGTALTDCLVCSATGPVILVPGKTPGAIELTVMPLGARSTAITLRKDRATLVQILGRLADGILSGTPRSEDFSVKLSGKNE